MAEDRPDGRFPTTRWSRVVAAADPDRPEARAALAELCGAYWFPVYALVPRKGHDPDAALDLTQDYFARLLEKPVLAAADRQKGRFRAFLLTDCVHFLANAHDRAARLEARQAAAGPACRSTPVRPKGGTAPTRPTTSRPSGSSSAPGLSPCWPRSSRHSAASTNLRGSWPRSRNSRSCWRRAAGVVATPRSPHGWAAPRGPSRWPSTGCASAIKPYSASRSPRRWTTRPRSTTRSAPCSTPWVESRRIGRVGFVGRAFQPDSGRIGRSQAKA